MFYNPAYSAEKWTWRKTMSRIVVGIMMLFMMIGAADKILFDGRYGYGTEFEKGIRTTGDLILMMAGIMCAAPLIGKNIGPALEGVFRMIGSDSSVFSGMMLAIDMGGFSIAREMTRDPDYRMISGVLLAATMGTAISFTIPVGIGYCPPEKRDIALKGILIGIICSPVSILVGGLVGNLPLEKVIRGSVPVLVAAALLTVMLSLRPQKTIASFLAFSRILSGLGILWLVLGILEQQSGITILPGMSPLREQIGLICEIGLTLSGAYPLVHFLRKSFSAVFSGAAQVLRVDEDAVIGMISGMANPIPAFERLQHMNDRGIVMMLAFLTPAETLLGDHLGYISAVYPQGVMPMIAGKFAAGITGMAIAAAVGCHSSACLRDKEKTAGIPGKARLNESANMR